VGFFPSIVGGKLGGAAAGFAVVPVDLGLEELVGGRIIADLFIGQEGDQAFLKDLKTAFDFAFGLGVGCHAVVDPHGGEGPLELGMGVQAVGWGTMAKEGKSVGIKAGGQAELLQQAAQMDKMAPGGVAGDKGAAEDFPGMVVEG
jgi:hypothetical protein